ncbi:hypothetical protein AAV97_18255 [Acinetobacter sp. Ag2]|uniref:hypothetical protein n=1 Tax=Acinetobacter sp. Ag2 TaxID=1646532 RepID=UPI0006297630|nr:hypothetical protein [Acinetobacter sp. Ag2]KKW75729.1 hypothetical protein AAV97_18255 [Acinetobacter sp. Ag2]
MINPKFDLIKKLGLKKARDMLNGYIPAYEDMVELRKQYDAWHTQTVNYAHVSPSTVVINKGGSE